MERADRRSPLRARTGSSDGAGWPGFQEAFRRPGLGMQCIYIHACLFSDYSYISQAEPPGVRPCSAASSALLLAAVAAPPCLAGPGPVRRCARDVVDRKAVIATVEPVHQLVARARIGGTIAPLAVKEGDESRPAPHRRGRRPEARVADAGARSRASSRSSPQRDQAQIDFDRTADAARTASCTQSQLDQARTRLDVAERNLQALRADRR